MTLQLWATNGWLKPHKTSVEEIGNLLAIVRRDTVEYDYVGGVTGSDADELIEFVKVLGENVLAWLKSKYPNLLK